MTESRPDPSPAEAETKPEKTPIWVYFAVFFGALPAVFAVFILGFITWYSMAHNEADCPYMEVVTRPVVDGVSVREDARRCIDDIAMHRWVVERDGQEPLDLGSRTLEAALIDRGFVWTAAIEEERVVIRIEYPGRGQFVLREPTEEELQP